MDRKKEVSQALERLRAGFVSHDILYAVDHFDDVRPIISDDGYQPPEIRGKLLELHGMAMELVNFTSQEDKKLLNKVLTLAEDIDGEISDILSEQTVARMQARHPGLDAVTVANTGHAPTLGEPEAIAAIERFLAELA